MSKGHSENEAGRIQKRKYQAPQLLRYGTLHDLTQTGTHIGSENQQWPATPGGSSCGPSLNPNASNYTCVGPSDRHVKQNIIRIGDHPFGFGLYLFDYKPEYQDVWGQGRQFGVMAQEVEKVMPQAVCTHPDGYKMVDYAILGIDRTAH
jgi:hypothetical protein